MLAGGRERAAGSRRHEPRPPDQSREGGSNRNSTSPDATSRPGGIDCGPGDGQRHQLVEYGAGRSPRSANGKRPEELPGGGVLGQTARVASRVDHQYAAVGPPDIGGRAAARASSGQRMEGGASAAERPPPGSGTTQVLRARTEDGRSDIRRWIWSRKASACRSLPAVKTTAVQSVIHHGLVKVASAYYVMYHPPLTWMVCPVM